VPSAAGSNATLHIVDTSPRREDRPHLESEVRRAHVVCVVYAIDDPQSFDRVVEYWLPTLRSLGVNLPVILVANKIDLRQGEVAQEALEDGPSECPRARLIDAEVLPIMADWKEVETVCVASCCRLSVLRAPQSAGAVLLTLD